MWVWFRLQGRRHLEGVMVGRRYPVSAVGDLRGEALLGKEGDGVVVCIRQEERQVVPLLCKLLQHGNDYHHSLMIAGRNSTVYCAANDLSIKHTPFVVVQDSAFGVARQKLNDRQIITLAIVPRKSD